MNKKNMFILTCAAVLLNSCAQMATPTGGDKDITPPEILKENIAPRNGSTNFSASRIFIESNEYVRIQPGRQPVISPPMYPAPEITVKGKKIIIDLEDIPLQPNTTYSIHMPGMIADITEGNILEDFTYVFSTGNHLDTGLVTGKLINATNHAPFAKAWMFLYTDTTQAPLLKSIPAYIARSKPDGSFTIEHVKPGMYKTFALADLNNNLRYDLAGEWIGFSDSIIEVGTTPAKRNLVLFKQPGKEIKVATDISMSATMHKIFFNQPVKNLTVKPITYVDNFRTSTTISGDSTVFVSFNSALNDTARFQIISDTTTIDTFYILPERNKKFEYTVTAPVNRLLMPGENIVFAVNEWSAWDSTKVLVTDTVTKNPVNKINFMNGIFPSISFPHTEEGFYKIELAQGALTSFQKSSDSISFYTKWLAPEKYGTFRLAADFSAFAKSGSRVIVELFKPNTFSDTLRLKTANESVFFKSVRPGSYSLRVFIDENGDNRWTTGNLENKQQPEQSFVYPQQVQIRANWDLELNWKPE